MLKLFLDYCIKNNVKINCVEDVFASGEKLTLPLMCGFKDVFINAKLHNLYGPTECAVDVTFYDVTFEDDVWVPSCCIGHDCWNCAGNPSRGLPTRGWRSVALRAVQRALPCSYCEICKKHCAILIVVFHPSR